MKTLHIPGTEDTPNIVLDEDTNTLEISGRSIPEDAVRFFQPILDWLQEYSETPKPQTNVVFRLEYFNTASSKLILDMLLMLEELHNNGSEVNVSWYYMEDDEDMYEAGEEYSDLIEVPFELISFDTPDA